MKNYRRFERYYPNEWEHDVEWKARRLEFIFEMQRYYPQKYIDYGLSKEKYDFYDINDNEVSRLAAKYNSYGDGELERYSKTKLYDLVLKYFDLERMKRDNPSEFLLKKNCNLYSYITEYRFDDVKYEIYYDSDFSMMYSEFKSF